MLLSKGAFPRKALSGPSLTFMIPVGHRFFRPSGYMSGKRPTEMKVVKEKRSRKWCDHITSPEILGTVQRSVFFRHRAFPEVASSTDTYLDLGSS